MKRKIQEYLKKPYSRVVIPDEDGSFFAEILEFSGCLAQGDTSSEALENLEKAAASWLEVALDKGIEIPEPFISIGYAGKVALRLPRSMHQQATRLAARDGVSLNQFLVSAIAARIGAEDLYSRLVEKLEQTVLAPRIIVAPIIMRSIEASSSTPNRLQGIPIDFTQTASTTIN